MSTPGFLTGEKPAAPPIGIPHSALRTPHLAKPRLASVPLATGLQWRGGGGFLFQEKSDGRHEFSEVRSAECGVRMTVNAERMRDGSLVVNDLIAIYGQDVTKLPTSARWSELVSLFRTPHSALRTRLCRTGSGGEFLEALLSAGGEGVVAKPWGAPFGANWYKCKRTEVFYCVVTGLDPHRGSVQLGRVNHGDTETQRAELLQTPCLRDSVVNCGWLALRGMKFESVRLGSVLKVEAFGLTANGQLREPRPDRDAPGSWLVRW